MNAGTISIPYTEDRHLAHAAGLTWGLVFGLESFAIGTLALIFMPTIWLKLAAIVLLVGGSSFVLVRIVLAPLWTAHSLTHEALIVRYGHDTLSVPRQQIATIVPVHERLPQGYQAGFSTDPRHERLVAALSPKNQFLIALDSPLETIVSGKPFTAREILINADRPELILGIISTVDATDPTMTPVTAPTFARTQQPPVPRPSTRVKHRQHLPGEGVVCIGIAKRYGNHQAVHALSFHVAPGEIVGLLGPNGAGKSTTIAMLTGILAPDSGTIRLAGHDLTYQGMDARRALGYVPDRPILYDTLTGREFLSYIAQLRALPHAIADASITHLIAALGLAPHADRLCRTYSFGTRSKITLAAALMHDPAVLILDEPFNGLDPQSAADVRAMLNQRAEAGAAILLSTHDLAIAESFCDRILVMAQGALVAEGDPQTLTQHGEVSLEERFRDLTTPGRKSSYPAVMHP